MFKFVQCLFLERHPWNKNGSLKSLPLYDSGSHVISSSLPACPARFRGLLKKSMADSRVQKAIVWFLTLKKRKRLSQLRDETRSSLTPHLHALKQRQYGLLQAILGCIIRDKVVSYYVWVIDQVWGQDGWILAKFFFGQVLAKKRTRPISSHLDRTKLVNKGFIIWL